MLEGGAKAPPSRANPRRLVTQASAKCLELKPKTAELKPKTAELKPKKAKDARVTSPRAPRPKTPELKPRSPDLRRRPHELKLCIYTMREHDRNYK